MPVAAVTLVGPAADVPPGVEELGQLLALRSGVWVNTYGNFDPAELDHSRSVQWIGADTPR